MTDLPTPAQALDAIRLRVMARSQTGSVFCLLCHGNDWEGGPVVHSEICPLVTLERATTLPALPPLRPIFERLAAVHPWWARSGRTPCFNGWSEWRVDGGTVRDAGWMDGHLNLLKQINRTRMGLGWSHHLDAEPGGQPPFTPRTFMVSRGDMDGGTWVQRGIHAATGLTDLHAYAEALALACEAEVQERGQLVIVHPEYAEGWWQE